MDYINFHPNFLFNMNLSRIRKDSKYEHLSTQSLGIGPVKIIKKERVTCRLTPQPAPVTLSLCICSFTSDFAIHSPTPPPYRKYISFSPKIWARLTKATECRRVIPQQLQYRLINMLPMLLPIQSPFSAL